MLRPRQHPDERAFTLTEVLVAMVLLVVVMAGLVSAIVGLSRGNSDAMANRAAQRQAIDALEQLRKDVRSVRSPAMEQWDGRRETLRQLAYFRIDQGDGAAAANKSRQLCSGLAYVDCIQDVTYAGPSQVWMRADVRDGAGWVGGECVGYVAASGALTRYLSRDWKGCGPSTGGIATRLLVANPMPTNPFSYTLRYYPGMQQNRVADPANCRTVIATSPGAIERNFITSIDIDLSGILIERRESATAGLRSSMQITGRTAGDYAYAMGCSF